MRLEHQESCFCHMSPLHSVFGRLQHSPSITPHIAAPDTPRQLWGPEGADFPRDLACRSGHMRPLPVYKEM